jgi:multidrug efflux pump
MKLKKPGLIAQILIAIADTGRAAGRLLLATVGVVVNAAILIIDAWRLSGNVMEAATSKFRPVLMSCAAALVGMLPMALGGGLGCELRQSMGIGSVGGIFVSTFVSLYFIPALCACLHRREGHSIAIASSSSCHRQ